MSAEETYGLFESYINGELSAQEVSSFEARLASDAGFKADFETHQAAGSVVYDAGLLDVKSRLDQIHNKKSGGQSPRGNKNWLIGGAVISIALIVVLAVSLSGDKDEEPRKSNSDTDRIENPQLVQVTKDELHVVHEEDTVRYVRHETEPIYIHPEEKDTITLVEIPEMVDPEVHDKDSVEAVVETIAADTLDVKEDGPNCDEIEITVVTELNRGSCIDKNEGQLTFDERRTSGGKSPYWYSIDGKEFSNQAYFTFLAAGRYNLYVKDANGCTKKIEPAYEVVGEACGEENNWVFTPAYEDWELPVAPDFTGHFEVLDKSGKLLYSEQITSGEPAEWSGSKKNGVPLELGTYVVKFYNSEGKLTTFGNLSFAR